MTLEQLCLFPATDDDGASSLCTLELASRCDAQFLRRTQNQYFLGHGEIPAGSGLLAVLVVADLFQPVDNLAVERFGDGDVAHPRPGGGAVPI